MDLVKESILKAAAATTLLLLIGILIGLQVDDARTGFLEEQIRESNLRGETFVVTQDYLEDSSNNYCKLASSQIPQLSKRNAQIGRDLESFSSKSVSNSYSYEYMKKKYYLNQLKLYNTLEKYKERCHTNTTLIFFFFDDSIESQRQGSVLTRYRKEVDNSTYVFSYNLGTDKSTVLEMLKSDYNVSEGPVVVINGNKTFRRYVPLKELEQVIE